MGLFDRKHILCAVGKVLTELIAQICICIAVSDNLHRFITADGAVVRGQHNGVIALSQAFEEVGDDRVAQPGERDGAVGTLVVGELPYHLRLGAGVGEHVDEVDDNNIEVVVLQRVVLLQ